MKTNLFPFAIILIVIAIVLHLLLASKVKALKSNKKVSLVYLLIAGLGFGIIGLTGFLGTKEKVAMYFLVIQILVLTLGIAHIWLRHKFIGCLVTGPFWLDLLFALGIFLMGSGVLLLCISLYSFTFQYLYLLSAAIWFIVPLLISHSLKEFLSIPNKIFKTWVYPINQSVKDPSDGEFASPVVISFIFQKKQEDEERTSFRVKAPLAMEFGRLFYFFINDYNDRHEDEIIEIKNNEDATPYSWIFFHKPNLLGMKTYIDPEEMVSVNGIKENSIIVCQRVDV